MDNAEAALIGAITGAIATILGATLTFVAQVRVEERRWRRSQLSARHQDIRMQASQAARHIMAVQHSMEWICWYAAKDSDAITNEVTSQYEAEIHRAMNDLVASLATLAMVDKDTYTRLESVAQLVYGFEAQIALAVNHFEDAHEESLRILNTLFQLVTDLAKIIPERLGNLFERSTY